MENFECYNPVKLIFGPGESKRIGSEGKALGSKALLVSYSDHAFMDALLSDATAQLESEGVTVVPFYKVVANPLLSTVREGIEVCRAEEIEFIVGIGGGSVIDTSKIIAAGVDYPGDAWGMIASRHDEDVVVLPESALPTLMVSTIPATGSEMNMGAVITNEETAEKSYLFSPHIYPRVAILDPELTCSLPPFQTACGIADAISHVLEVYLNGADSAPLSQRIMEGVVTTLIDYAPKVLEHPDNIDARAQIQWAACVAWNGWTWPGTLLMTPMHMIAHALSARYNMAHGATLAITMPATMKYVCEKFPSIYAQFGEKMLGLDTAGMDQQAAARAAVDAFEAFLKGIGLSTSLSEHDIPETAIEQLVDDAVRVYFTADGILPAREPFTRDDVTAILKLAL